MTRDNADFRDSRALNRQLVAVLADAFDLSAYWVKKVEPGQILAHAGRPMASLPLVVTGTLDAVVYVGNQGNLVIPISFEIGELAMLSMLFSREPSHASLLAGQNASVRWIPVADIESCLQQNQQRLVLLVRFLAQRLREVQVRERGWLERGVAERVNAAITRAMRDAPPPAGGKHMLVTTHEHLAARCGVSRPKLSMELKRLEQCGQLLLHRGAIEIVQPERFSALD